MALFSCMFKLIEVSGGLVKILKQIIFILYLEIKNGICLKEGLIKMKR